MAEKYSLLYSFPVEKGKGFFPVKAIADLTGNLKESAFVEKVEIAAKRKVRLASMRSPSSLSSYVLYAERVTTPMINVFIRGGGRTEHIKPREESIALPISSEMKKIARILITEDGALETLLLLAEDGPTSIDTLVGDVIPQDRLLKVVCELSRCNLVEVSGSVISPTPEATKLVAKILDNL